MKRIDLPHKVCGMTCMVNGLEDLYERQTGVRLPDWFLFYMSGMAGFSYLKMRRAPVPRFVGWGTRPQEQYAVLGEAIGFTWQKSEGRSFKSTWKAVQACINAGQPVILGAVDMYHLPYYTRFYHQVHIPIHYVLLVGYDDARKVALIQDCDRAEVQDVPYSDLQAAWDVQVPGLSKKNTFYTFAFNAELADVPTIARRALRHKTDFMLKPPATMFGLPGIRKLAHDLPGWPDELTADQLDTCLRQLVEYTGVPPMLPARLLGDPDMPDDHSGGRKGFASMMVDVAEWCDVPVWAEAGALLAESGQRIQTLTNDVVDYLLEERRDLAPAGELLNQIVDLEKQAHTRIAEGLKLEAQPA